jgi:hypothetical protein
MVRQVQIPEVMLSFTDSCCRRAVLALEDGAAIPAASIGAVIEVNGRRCSCNVSVTLVPIDSCEQGEPRGPEAAAEDSAPRAEGDEPGSAQP